MEKSGTELVAITVKDREQELSKESSGSENEQESPANPHFLSTEARQHVKKTLQKREPFRRFMMSVTWISFFSSIIVCWLVVEVGQGVSNAYDIHLPLQRDIAETNGVFNEMALLVEVAVDTGDPKWSARWIEMEPQLLALADQVIALESKVSSDYLKNINNSANTYFAMVYQIFNLTTTNLTAAQELYNSTQYIDLEAMLRASTNNLIARVNEVISESDYDSDVYQTSAIGVQIFAMVLSITVACASRYIYVQLRTLETNLDAVLVQNYQRLLQNHGEQNIKFQQRYKYYLQILEQHRYFPEAQEVFNILGRRMNHYVQVLRNAVSELQSGLLMKEATNLGDVVQEMVTAYPKILAPTGDPKLIQEDWHTASMQYLKTNTQTLEKLLFEFQDHPESLKFHKRYALLETLENGTVSLPAFRFVVNDEDMLPEFRSFLKMELSEENLVFYQDVETFSLITDQKLLNERAKELYDSAIGSDTVNLSGNIKSRLKAHFQKGADSPSNLFQEAKNAIEQLLLNDSFLRFVKSEEFRNFESQFKEIEAKTLEYYQPLMFFIKDYAKFILSYCDQATLAQDLKLAGKIFDEGIQVFPSLLPCGRACAFSYIKQFDGEIKEIEDRIAAKQERSLIPKVIKKVQAEILGARGGDSWIKTEPTKPLLSKLTSLRSQWVQALLKYQNLHLQCRAKKFERETKDDVSLLSSSSFDSSPMSPSRDLPPSPSQKDDTDHTDQPFVCDLVPAVYFLKHLRDLDSLIDRLKIAMEKDANLKERSSRVARASLTREEMQVQ